MRKPISILLLALAAMSVLMLPRIVTEPDAIFFFPEDSELVRNYRSIEEQLTGLLVVEMVVESRDGRPVTSDQHLGQLQGFVMHAGELPGLTGVVSALPWLEASLGASMVPEDVFRAYVNQDESRMRLSFRFRNISDIPYARSAASLKSLWADSDTRGLDMSLTGLVPLILEAQDALLRTQALIFPAIVLIMTLIFVLITRSLKVLLAAGAANFLPLLLLLGAMAVFDIPVNSINLFVASVMIGVIVDDTIHLLHAWREEGSMDKALAEVGQALWVTSATMALAFSSMFISGLAPIVQFGMLSVITLAVAYACDVYLLPWLLSFRWARS